VTDKGRYYYDEKNFDLSCVMTNGNYSWIPLRLEGAPAAYVELILAVMSSFEAANPNLKILNWHIETRPFSGCNSGAYVYGIWVHHQLR
jgi:hypothetical protein